MIFYYVLLINNAIINANKNKHIIFLHHIISTTSEYKLPLLTIRLHVTSNMFKIGSLNPSTPISKLFFKFFGCNVSFYLKRVIKTNFIKRSMSHIHGIQIQDRITAKQKTKLTF